MTLCSITLRLCKTLHLLSGNVHLLSGNVHLLGETLQLLGNALRLFGGHSVFSEDLDVPDVSSPARNPAPREALPLVALEH